MGIYPACMRHAHDNGSAGCILHDGYWSEMFFNCNVETSVIIFKPYFRGRCDVKNADGIVYIYLRNVLHQTILTRVRAINCCLLQNICTWTVRIDLDKKHALLRGIIQETTKHGNSNFRYVIKAMTPHISRIAGGVASRDGTWPCKYETSFPVVHKAQENALNTKFLCSSHLESSLFGNKKALSLPHGVTTYASNSCTRELESFQKTQQRLLDEGGGESNEILCQTSNEESVATKWFRAVGEIHVSFALFLLNVFSIFFPFKTTCGRNQECFSPEDRFNDETSQTLRCFVNDGSPVLKTAAPPLPKNNQKNVQVFSDAPGSNEFTTEDIRRESFRLSSFQRFPASVPIDARQFAAAGFYHTGQADEVKCFACSITLRNLSSGTDPFLLSLHRPTCAFTRGQDDCGNIRLDPLSSAPSTLQQAGAAAQRRPAGQVLFGNTTAYQSANVRSAPTFANNPTGPRITLASNPNVGPIRHYQGLDMRNFQTARPVAPPVPSYDVPIYRQLATIPNPDHARLIRSLNLCRESHRFQTFTGEWPRDAAPSPEDMAASGWFYLGNLDRTQCFCCGGVLRNWRRLDNSNTEHITHFPHCLMAQGHERRNIPDTDRQALLPVTRAVSQLTDQQRADLRIMFPCNFPTTPSMQSMAERVRTFNNWHFTRATPQMHAEAGFFALGVRDRVKCFYCNGGLQNWRQNDDPWEEHAKWYPTCEFLLQQRGPEFIHNIVARFPNINRPMLRAPGRDVPPPVPAAPQASIGLEEPVSSTPTIARTGNHQFGAIQGLQPQAGRAQTSDPLQAAMESEVATTVIGMGFEESLVRDVMRRKIDQDRGGYHSAADLLDAVVEEQSVRESEESAREPEQQYSMETNLAPAASFEEERMDEEENLDLYQSGVDTTLRSIDVAESAFSPSVSSSRAQQSVSETSVTGMESSNNPQMSSLAQPPQVMDTSAVRSSVAPAVDPFRTTSMPEPKLPEQTNTESQRRRSSSLPESEEELKRKLTKKLQQLKDERVCKVCLDREADMVFIPCGHICCCLECTKALRMCPICRKKIEKAVRTYTS